MISSAGFGRSVSWESDASDALSADSGHTMTFRTAVSTALRTIFIKLLTPTWGISLGSALGIKAVQDTRASYVDLEKWLLEFISQTRADIVAGVVDTKGDNKFSINKGALLKRMVQANVSLEDGGDGTGLTDQELLSDVFVSLNSFHFR